MRVSCVGFALMLPGHMLGATGAGDVKFMAAVGAIVGPALVVSAFLLRRSRAGCWRWQSRSGDDG